MGRFENLRMEENVESSTKPRRSDLACRRDPSLRALSYSFLLSFYPSIEPFNPRTPLYLFRLQLLLLKNPLVVAFLGYELFVGALLGELPIFQDDDQVSVL
jgi:hypothetical protein